MGRSENLVDADGKPRDWLGKVVPHRLSFLSAARSVAGLADQFVEIPAEFWSEDIEEERRVALVSCPCGETPAAAVGVLEACACHRYYLYTGKAVRVANRPKQYADEPVDPDTLGADDSSD